MKISEGKIWLLVELGAWLIGGVLIIREVSVVLLAGIIILCFGMGITIIRCLD